MRSGRHVNQHEFASEVAAMVSSVSPVIAAPSRAPTGVPFTVTVPVAGTR